MLVKPSKKFYHQMQLYDTLNNAILYIHYIILASWQIGIRKNIEQTYRSSEYTKDDFYKTN